MIAAVLTILGLLIDFFEKVHLFKKPITKTKVSIIALLFLSVIVSITKSYLDDKSNERSSAIIDSLNTKSSVLSGLISDLRIENKTASREYEDSLTSFHYYTTDLLAKYGLKVDTLGNKITKLDTSISKETLPTLSIIQTPVFTSIGSENTITYTLTALNSDVHLMEYYYALLSVKEPFSRKPIFTGEPSITGGNSMNFSTVIPKETGKSLVYFLDRAKLKNMSDTLFWTIEFKYKSKNNKRLTPVRKVFMVLYNEKKIMDVDNYMFYQAAVQLRKKKIWTKFYDL